MYQLCQEFKIHMRACCLLILLMLSSSCMANPKQRMLVSEPENADVYFNEKMIGKTPLDLKSLNSQFISDTVKLTLKKEFFKNKDLEITSKILKSDITVKVSLELDVGPLLRYDGYFIDNKRLKDEDVNRKSLYELDILRTEIYAQYGAELKDLPLKKEFENKAWYKKNPYFNASFISENDKANMALLDQMPRQRGVYFLEIEPYNYSTFDVYSANFITPQGNIKSKKLPPKKIDGGKPVGGSFFTDNNFYYYNLDGSKVSAYRYQFKTAKNTLLFENLKGDYYPICSGLSFDEKSILFRYINDHKYVKDENIIYKLDFESNSIFPIKQLSENRAYIFGYISRNELLIQYMDNHNDIQKTSIYNLNTNKETIITEENIAIQDYSYDGKILYIENGKMGSLDIQTRKKVLFESIDATKYDWPRWSPKGDKVLSSFSDKNYNHWLYIYDVKNDKLQKIFKENKDTNYSYSFMNDNENIIILKGFPYQEREYKTESKIFILNFNTLKLTNIATYQHDITTSIFANACPFVYLKMKDGHFQMIGEILTQNREASQYGWSKLNLPIKDIFYPLTILIKEELYETTYIDSVVVSADQSEYSPDSGSLIDNKDRKFLELNRGELCQLKFSQIGKDVKNLQLIVTGYYKPLHYTP